MTPTEVKANKLESAVKSQEKKVNKTATGIIEQKAWRIKQNERDERPTGVLQEVESARVQGARERDGDCSQLHSKGVCGLQRQSWHPNNASKIEVTHRTGQRSSTRARPILVRFFDHKKIITVS